MKPYPKYKDSWIEWIGEVSEGWEVGKLKFSDIECDTIGIMDNKFPKVLHTGFFESLP